MRAAAHARLERLREEGGDRRLVGIGAAVLLELLLFAVLLTLGYSKAPPEAPEVAFVSVDSGSAEEQTDSNEPEPEARREAPSTTEQSESADPVQTPALPIPPPAAVIPTTNPLPPQPASTPEPPTSRRIRAVVRGEAMGPAAPAAGASAGDSQVVGTAPNGEPLYAAKWYREPYPDELRGFLSTASGPGWGLIACRTVEDFRVEDCVALEEQPRGSNINRAVLAAAYQFRVRPPQRGGKSLVGSWVRIRIDYTLQPSR